MIFSPGLNTFGYMKTVGLKKYPFSKDDLAKAYRFQMKKHHPDKGGSHQKSQEIIKAKKALSNLTSEVVNGCGLGLAPIEAPTGATETCNKCDGSGQEHYDINHTCLSCLGTGKKVTKCKACKDGKFTLKNKKEVTCKACSGSGNYSVSKCTTCKGSGTERRKDRVKCSKCGGHGKVKKVMFNPVIPENVLSALFGFKEASAG